MFFDLIYFSVDRLLQLLIHERNCWDLNEFREYFRNMNSPWYFAKPADTRKLLEKIGYINTKVHLHNDHVILTNREIYSRFVKTVIMKPFLQHLPDDKIRNRYLELFLDEVKRVVLVITNLKCFGP